MIYFNRLLMVLAIVGLFSVGIVAAQEVGCTIITGIAGNKVTLTPENKSLKPFVIETEDPTGLKVGDRVWVKDGKIVSCALPGKGPYPAPKRQLQ